MRHYRATLHLRVKRIFVATSPEELVMRSNIPGDDPGSQQSVSLLCEAHIDTRQLNTRGTLNVLNEAHLQ